MPRCSGAFYKEYSQFIYFTESGNVVVPCGVVGVVAGALFVVLRFLITSEPVELSPLEKNKVEVMHRIATIPANNHVPFSNTSFVCFTPIIWLPKPPNVPDKPPPLGFWINTIMPRSALANITKIKNKMLILVVV